MVFASNNKNKLEEVIRILPSDISILTLDDVGCHDELPETHDTLDENAIEKAEYVATRYQVNCFAEDTGLEVEALNNAPGVYSARYAGEQRSSEANIRLLLENMRDQENRAARFRTVIALFLNEMKYIFQGEVAGQILYEPAGAKGFGYDPVFRPEGYDTSFAQMELTEKNKISHRGKAITQLIEFLSGI